MNNPRINNSRRSRRSTTRSSRSKLYERYDVNIEASASGGGGGRWFGGEEEAEGAPPLDRPIEEWTNAQVCKFVWQSARTKSRTHRKLTVIVAAALLLTIAKLLEGNGDGSLTKESAVLMKDGSGRTMERPAQMDTDSHKRNNPFAPAGQTTTMEGMLEVKRVGGRTTHQSLEELQQQHLQQQEAMRQQQEFVRGRDSRNQNPGRRKRWNPCTNPKYELERHDHEPRHGDLCRAKGGLMGLYECPEGCHDTGGAAPYCANDATHKRAPTQKSTHTVCRVRDPAAPPEYRCDAGSVCIMAVETPTDQFKGEGEYRDASCEGKCAGSRARRDEAGQCTSDLDCSLAGVCSPDGVCRCDPWAEGPDCSYLRFVAVDRAHLGYLDKKHSSWGGSVVRQSDGEYYMFASEIVCKKEQSTGRRCGLNNWETHSRIVRATSANIEGPYRRVDVVLPPEHHNPSVHVSPKTQDWHLFSISGPTGPIVRMTSSDEGRTWGVPMTVSPRQNPGPLLKEDGSTLLFYRADAMDLPSPTCSDEGIAVQLCPSDTEPCETPKDVPVFGHTGEDPSVFIDHRGNYHLLFNALPYKCVPKWHQGGHAWSTDGVHWSAPRVGAFNTTIQFTDGSSMTCERRERPQMILDPSGKPVAMVSGVTGCPAALGDADSSSDGRFYKGADDCFTLVQKMNSKS